MKKLIFSLGIGSLCFLFLSACSNETEYDEAIDEVIALENESLSNGQVQKDIEKLGRENTQIEVFDDGEYIQITYEIRENDVVDTVYQKEDNSYEHVVEDMEGKEPVYTENIDE